MSPNTSSFFRAYDIRGIYGTEITKEVAYRVGKAFCSYLGKGSTINVARDTRKGSEELAKYLISGITETGCDIIDIGRVPSPVLYYSTSKTCSVAGVMVTASHLPPEWNGFKFCDRTGQIISEGFGLEKIHEIYMNGSFEISIKGKHKSYRNILEDYMQNIVKNTIAIRPNFKITVDTSNSVPSLFIPRLFEGLGIDAQFINTKICEEPIHGVEPGLETMKMLSEEVIRNSSDLGIMYDSDGDRLAIVDEKGRIYPDGTTIIALFSRIYSKIDSTNPVVVDVTCPSSLSKFIEKLGMKPLTSRVGHNFCSSMALQNNASFAAQFSGHFSLRESEYRDDAIFASVKLIEFLSNLGQPLSEYLLQFVPDFFYDTVSIDIDDDLKQTVLQRIKKNVKERGEITLDIDGVKVIKPVGSYLIRYSNTSNIIRIMAEGQDQKAVEKMKNLAIGEIRRVLQND